MPTGDLQRCSRKNLGVGAVNDNTPTESLIGFDADGVPSEKTMSFSERLRAIHYIEPVLPKREDLAYMAPEAVEAMLRRCNHVCRTSGCGQVVDRCGQNCEDCQSYIESRLKQSDDATTSSRKPGPIRRFLSWVGLVGK